MNLDHADMAYEWVFNGANNTHQRAQMMMPPTDNEKKMIFLLAGQHMPSEIRGGADDCH